MLASDVFGRSVVLSFQEDAIGIRLPPPFPPPLAGEGQGGGVNDGLSILLPSMLLRDPPVGLPKIADFGWRRSREPVATRASK